MAILICKKMVSIHAFALELYATCEQKQRLAEYTHDLHKHCHTSLMACLYVVLLIKLLFMFDLMHKQQRSSSDICAISL